LQNSEFKANIGAFKEVLGVEFNEGMRLNEIVPFICPAHNSFITKHFPAYLQHLLSLTPQEQGHLEITLVFKYKRGDDFYWINQKIFKHFSEKDFTLGYVLMEYTDITHVKKDNCSKFIVYDKHKGYLINEELHPYASLIKNLTPTELAITKLIAKGLSDKEIAPVQGISIHTVKQHKKHIFLKLHINKSTELVALAYDCGLVS